MHFSFAKYHGLGNDFIVIDDRLETFPSEDSSLISKLCKRRTGVGADGLILLNESFKADFWMRIFNADGKETEMCGNGLRCFLAYLRDLGLALITNKILVGGKIYLCTFKKNLIAVQMGKPKDISWNIAVSLSGKEIISHYVHIGVPHVVVFVDDVDTIEVEKEGSELRWHPIFQPKGVNVNFASELPNGELKVRTFERGVEGETLACGTGASAVAYSASKMLGKQSSHTIWTRSNEKLEIRISDENEVEMLGEATYVFRGHYVQKSLRPIAV